MHVTLPPLHIDKMQGIHKGKQSQPYQNNNQHGTHECPDYTLVSRKPAAVRRFNNRKYTIIQTVKAVWLW